MSFQLILLEKYFSWLALMRHGRAVVSAAVSKKVRHSKPDMLLCEVGSLWVLQIPPTVQ